MNINSKIMRKQLGISLVEIMVALVISIFLLGGVIQVYIANKTSYRFSDASSRIQENARFALETISSDLRMTGYWGCAQFIANNNDHLVNNLNTASASYNAALHDFIGADAISATVNDGLNGSDSLTVSGSKAAQNIILAPFMTTVESDIEVSATTAIAEEDIVIISNCQGADIYEVSAVATSTTAGQIVVSHNTAGKIGNMNAAACTATGGNQCLSQTYAGDAAISTLQTITYTVAAGANTAEPALWRSENGVNDELIEGVEQMQILFGVDTDNDGTPNQYLTSDLVTDSTQVSAVRIFLVVRSDEDNITDNLQVITINGVSTNAPDNRLRQVFSSTVALRNRIGGS